MVYGKVNVDEVKQLFTKTVFENVTERGSKKKKGREP